MSGSLRQATFMAARVDSTRNTTTPLNGNTHNRANNQSNNSEIEMTNISNDQVESVLVDAAVSRQPDTPIEELVSKIIIHSDRPIENLPEISPPELKIIGRCVTFVADTVIGGESKRFHYEGLVGTINKDTVMLINVYRFTDEDFQVHRLEKKRESEVDHDVSVDGKIIKNNNISKPVIDATDGFERSTPEPLHNSENCNGLTISREEQENITSNYNSRIENNNNNNSNNRDINDHEFTSGNWIHNEKESKLCVEYGEGLTVQAHQLNSARNKLQMITGSYGPIPYMTFIRSHIHNVEFAHDPTSSFYSLFRDPSREIFDMQCLRMFVRRYLVHTSQGNNPRQVPLRAFVTCRCNCPNLDNNLLHEIAHEELAHLIKVDRDIKRAQRRKERLLRRNIMALRAPPGIFSGTGILFFTGLPRQTLSVAVLEFIMMIVLIVHFGVTITIAEPHLIYTYMLERIGYLAACAAFTVIASLLSAIHSVRMRFPLKRHLALVFIRFFWVIAALICALIMMAIMVKSASIREIEYFVYNKASSESLCNFYESYECSGFNTYCPHTLSPNFVSFKFAEIGIEDNNNKNIFSNNNNDNTRESSIIYNNEESELDFKSLPILEAFQLYPLATYQLKEVRKDATTNYLVLTENSEQEKKICSCESISSANVGCKAAIRGEVQRSTVPAVCFAISLVCILIIDTYLHYKLFCIARFFSQLAETSR